MVIDKDAIFLSRRIKELADRALKRDVFTHTSFLNLNEQAVFFSIKDLPKVNYKLIGGYEAAERKYFWRECYWEQRRIVKGLSHAAVKAPFSQEINGQIETEHMWLDDIAFDGEQISGTLINSPNLLTNIQAGEHITGLPYREISD